MNKTVYFYSGCGLECLSRNTLEVSKIRLVDCLAYADVKQLFNRFNDLFVFFAFTKEVAAT